MTEDRYAPTARLLHRLMAAGFISMCACGHAMLAVAVVNVTAAVKHRRDGHDMLRRTL
ncbi:MAG: hypothetical protein OXF33_06930 [Rhodospirillales bacterium]|nr:hypothetical protein [Rhodospirillales bacterium]